MSDPFLWLPQWQGQPTRNASLEGSAKPPLVGCSALPAGCRILVSDRADASLAVWQERDRVDVPAAEQCIDDPTRECDRRGFGGAGRRLAERRSGSSRLAVHRDHRRSDGPRRRASSRR